MEAARQLLYRIRRRDLFSFVGEILLSPQERHLVANRGAVVKDALLRLVQSRRNRANDLTTPTIASEDVICHVVKMGYGKGGKNPVLVICMLVFV